MKVFRESSMDYFEEIKINNFLKTIKDIECDINIKLKKIFNYIDKKKLEEILLNEKITINLFTALLTQKNINSMWYSRSLNFISILINALHKSKEIYSFPITPYFILYYCKIENLIDLNMHFNQKNMNIKKIENYLYSLPGYIPNVTEYSNLPISMQEQHYYVIMNIKEILHKIIEVYNYKENKINCRIQTWNLIKNLENF